MDLGSALSMRSWSKYVRLGRGLIRGEGGGVLAHGGDERPYDLLQNLPDLVIVVDTGFTIRYANASAVRVLGYRPVEMVGYSLAKYLHPEDAQHVLRSLVQEPEGYSSPPATLQFRMRHADDSWRYVEVAVADLPGGAQPGGAQSRSRICCARDITARKSREDELAHRALHDPLTGLANRSLFMDRLGHALMRAQRHEERVAVLFLDLDNFKTVNDGLGHEAGDEVLVAVGKRLRSCLRPGDTASRLGGDEFATLLEDVTDTEDTVRLAERVFRVLQAPITVGWQQVFVTASMGVALNDFASHRAEDLLRAADIAMYRAKETGGSSYKLFDDETFLKTLQRLELENDLRRALESGELKTYYQPILSLETREIVGMEALLRWEHSRRGVIHPEEFISLAEKTNLIVPIGQLILEEACSQTKEWQGQFADPSLSINVNLSAKQFQQPDLAERVGQVLQKTGLEPSRLILEITESLVVEDTRFVAETIQKLQDLGVRLAADDFGTGLSSLSYLRRFPLDFIKVDRLFVGLIEQEENSARALISALIGMAKALNIEVIAEGVESIKQLEELREIECSFGQGYYFSEPLPGHAASEVLQASRNAQRG